MNKSHSNKPVIGITTNFLDITDAPFSGHQRIYVNKGYIDAITIAGGIPLLLPVSDNTETTNHLLSLVDGVLLSGGQDVHPSLYNEECHPLLGTTSKERDAFEVHVIDHIRKNNKPLLGICRGQQIINVAFGGTLYQDLSLYSPSLAIKHSQEEPWDQATHRIRLVPKSMLHQIFNHSEVLTNSYHHQAVKDVAPGFSVAASSEDGIIEALEKNDPSSWIVSVQWHPELMIYNSSQMLPLFRALISEARSHRSQK